MEPALKCQWSEWRNRGNKEIRGKWPPQSPGLTCTGLQAGRYPWRSQVQSSTSHSLPMPAPVCMCWLKAPACRCGSPACATSSTSPRTAEDMLSRAKTECEGAGSTKKGKASGLVESAKKADVQGGPQIARLGVQEKGQGDCHAPGSWPANPHSQPILGCKGVTKDIPGESRHQAKSTGTPKSWEQAAGSPWQLEGTHS